MTDPNIPANLTRDEAQAVREWAEHIISTPETSMPMIRAAARVVLHTVPAPSRPTLADMTEEERAACQWMQADIIVGHDPLVITHIERSDGTATILDRNGRYDEVPAEEVTPRPDLPRLAWPGDTPAPAPALPDGWRLADHKSYGRVIVTNTVPNSSGYIYYVIPEDGDHRGYGWGPCKPYELTYLAQGADQ